MSFNFVIPELQINGAGTPPLQFFRRGFNLNGTGGSAPSWQDIVLSGNGSLTLTNAKTNGLNYVKLFGACEQENTPYPDKAADIKCNNGVIKVRRKSGLPLDYQQVEWLKSTQAIELDKPTKDTYEFRASIYREDLTPQYIYQSDTASSGTTNTTAYLSSTVGNWRFDGQTSTIAVPDGEQVITRQNKNGVWLNDTQVGVYTNVNAFTSSSNLKLFGVQSTPTLRLISFEVLDGNAFVYNIVPVRKLSTNELGVYDKVDGKFFTDASSTITAGQDVADEIEIYTDGAAETVEIGTTGGTATAENLLGVDRVADIQEVLTGEITRNISYKIFDGTESFGSSSAYGTALYIQSAAGSWKADKSKTPMCTHFLGVAMTSGVQNANTCFFNASGHFYFRTSETAADFKTWLTDLYNAGTPMVLVYVSSAPTTETVTGQPLTIQAGTNTVEITKASIKGLPLEVSYKGTV